MQDEVNAGLGGADLGGVDLSGAGAEQPLGARLKALEEKPLAEHASEFERLHDELLEQLQQADRVDVADRPDAVDVAETNADDDASERS